MIWLFFALLTVILATSAALLEKKVLLKEHATEFSVCLALINVLLVLPLAFYVDFTSVTLQHLGVIYGASIFGTLAFWCLAKAIRHLDISFVSPFMAVGPAFTAILAYLILGEVLASAAIMGIGVIVFGSLILEWQTYPSKSSGSRKYVYLIVLSIILYGFGAVLDRVVLYRLGVSSLAYIFFIHIFVGLNFLVILKLMRRSVYETAIGFKNFWPFLVAIGILTVSYRWSEAQAVSLMAVGVVFAIKRTSTLLVTVIGGKVFHENHLLWRGLAALVMIVGIWLII